MEALSGLDASFLYLESDDVPMNIGGVAVLQGSLSFDDFCLFLSERVHTVDRLQQKLVSVAAGVDRPYWVKDPDFDLRRHVFQRDLPAPGGWSELRQMASDVFSGKIERDKPLWEFVFVDGVDNIAQVPKGSVALISKIHHAGFDGKSGADLMSMLFDISPAPKTPAKAKPETGETPLGAIRLLGKSAFDMVSRPAKLPGLLRDASKSALKASYMTKFEGVPAPRLPFSAPDSLLNAPVAHQRRWDSAVLELDRVKALRKGIQGRIA